MSSVLHSINVSSGGVPKFARRSAAVRASSVEGDHQRDLRYHGGPTRAVCLYSLELIQSLRAEGHPIDVGSIGENFTLAGVPWERMVPGATLEVGAVQRVAQKVHPGWSRLYARVLREGTVAVGDKVILGVP